MRKLHSAILGLCALIESVPYSVESWMPPLTEGGLYCVHRYRRAAFNVLYILSACPTCDRPPSDFNDNTPLCLRIQEGTTFSFDD